MIKTPTQCEICAHRTPLDIGGWACAAFPEGIPDEVYDGTIDHRQPIEGDRGVQFEPDPEYGTPKMVALVFGEQT